MTQLISTIAIAMGASWVSGINLYASVATLGLLGRFAQLQLPGELQVLTSWWVIGVAVVLYVIEFCRRQGSVRRQHLGRDSHLHPSSRRSCSGCQLLSAISIAAFR